MKYISRKFAVAEREALGLDSLMPSARSTCSAVLGACVITLLSCAGASHATVPLESWLAGHAADSRHVTFSSPYQSHGDPVGYICPSVPAARAVIAAIPSGDDIREARKYHAFEQALAKTACVRASGRFAPTAIHEARYIVCGEECWSHWTAMEARDEGGQMVALIYDASLM